MKKINFLNFIGLALVIFFSANIYVQAAGAFTFSFTPVAYSPDYEPGTSKNALAVWIQTSAGAFVKTKLRYAGSNTSDHLPIWAVNSRGTASNCLATACNKTDATTGATLTSWAAKTIVWDGKNVNGILVADGAYKVAIQETWNHGTTGTTTRSYSFTKGPNIDHQVPANDVDFTNIKLAWVPAIANPTVVVNVVNIKCKGNNTGSATATAMGSPPYTYIWSTTPVQTASTATGLAAGTYSVTVKDLNGTTTANAIITEPAVAITASLNSTNASTCSASDGSVTSNVSGGTTPYSYLWSNNKTTPIISGLASGNYSLTITDGNGCKRTTVATVSCSAGGSSDAGIASIGNPNGSICGSSIIPVMNLKNFGTSTLTSCKILYHVDANSDQTFNWNGSLATGTSTDVTLPSLSASAGAHTFYSSTSSPNGSTDANPGNDQSQSTFNIKGSASALPLIEGFESGTFLPPGWIVVNPDNDAGWEVNTLVAHTGNNSVGFNNCDGNGSGVDMTGTKDRFITNAYDFSNATSSASLSFDVTSAVLSYKGQIYADTLAIFSSKDCGATWNQIYLRGGADLSGIITSESCWTPSSSDWRTYNVNLSNLVGQSGAMFAFENRSGWGEWMYLDNITITAITGISPINNPLAGFSLYPNPATTSFTIEGTCNAKLIHYSIYNVVGAEVKTGDIITNGIGFNGKIQMSNIPGGMYFIKVSDTKNTWTQKLSVQ